MPSLDYITSNFNNMDSREISGMQARVIYCNVFCSFMNFIIMLIVAIQLGPVIQDAGILIKDASISLKDFSVMLPEVNGLIPEARNTTRILGKLIPAINKGMYELNQLCIESHGCN
jgi:hypothetical protein